MAMQLGVRRLSARHSPRGRVPVLSRDHILGVLFHNLAAVTTSHDRHLLSQVMDRLLDRATVGLLDLLTLPRVTERPHRRNGLRRTERHIDPATTAAAGALGSQPTTRAGIATLHQRNEISAIHRPARLDPQPFQGLGIGEPPAGSLRHLPFRGEVVIPALGLHSLALQVARVPAAPRRTYARRSHHIVNDRQHAGAASARTAPGGPCMLSVLEAERSEAGALSVACCRSGWQRLGPLRREQSRLTRWPVPAAHGH
jgi:hypothetical protein